MWERVQRARARSSCEASARLRSAQLQVSGRRSSILSGSSSRLWRTQVGNNPSLIFPFWGKQPHAAGREGRRLAVGSLHRNPGRSKGDAGSGLKGDGGRRRLGIHGPVTYGSRLKAQKQRERRLATDRYGTMAHGSGGTA